MSTNAPEFLTMYPDMCQANGNQTMQNKKAEIYLMTNIFTSTANYCDHRIAE